MPFEMHTVEVADLSSLQNTDRVVLAASNAVAYTGNGVAGSQTIAVAFGTGNLPSTYSVLVTPNQTGVAASVAAKTNTGFNVILTPCWSSVATTAPSLSAGTFDCLVIG